MNTQSTEAPAVAAPVLTVLSPRSRSRFSLAGSRPVQRQEPPRRGRGSHRRAAHT